MQALDSKKNRYGMFFLEAFLCLGGRYGFFKLAFGWGSSARGRVRRMVTRDGKETRGIETTKTGFACGYGQSCTKLEFCIGRSEMGAV
jgi:hypothetical protein